MHYSCKFWITRNSQEIDLAAVGEREEAEVSLENSGRTSQCKRSLQKLLDLAEGMEKERMLFEDSRCGNYTFFFSLKVNFAFPV